MKSLTQYFNDKELLFKDFAPLDPKLLEAEKIKIYDAVGVNKAYYAIFIIDSKSRFLRKNADEIEVLFQKMVDLNGHNYKHKIALIQSPLCSKAKAQLEQYGWSVWIDFM